MYIYSDTVTLTRNTMYSLLWLSLAYRVWHTVVLICISHSTMFQKDWRTTECKCSSKNGLQKPYMVIFAGFVLSYFGELITCILNELWEKLSSVYFIRLFWMLIHFMFVFLHPASVTGLFWSGLWCISETQGVIWEYILNWTGLCQSQHLHTNSHTPSQLGVI